MYAILSDIHGNMYAFQRVLEDMSRFDIEGVILLGDLIDYGMQSNEVIDYLKNSFKYNNIWGNHERAIMLEDFTRFSSKRGEECARYTAGILSDASKEYLNGMNKDGIQELCIYDMSCLAVHGSFDDYYWKPISPDDVKGDYREYDFVFSGHSHYSHMFEKLYEADDPNRRNKHAVYFINPGSVGQPRNHNPAAQYALIDSTLNIYMRSIPYEISRVMSLYHGQVDRFYKERLEFGV